MVKNIQSVELTTFSTDRLTRREAKMCEKGCSGPPGVGNNRKRCDVTIDPTIDRSIVTMSGVHNYFGRSPLINDCQGQKVVLMAQLESAESFYRRVCFFFSFF